MDTREINATASKTGEVGADAAEVNHSDLDRDSMLHASRESGAASGSG
jgi:hypothetical protein